MTPSLERERRVPPAVAPDRVESLGHGDTMSLVLGPFSLDRVVRAVELVRQRLLRATAALEAAAVPYAPGG